MSGEDILISEEQYKLQLRTTMLILWNTYNFFITYANLDGWKPDGSEKLEVRSENILDEWILNLLEQLKVDVTKSLDNYDTVGTIDALKLFITDLSTWYIRRSRDRVGPSAEDEKDKKAFYETTHYALVTLTQLLAPIVPFVSEEMYRNLTDEESVHLTDWPKSAGSINQGLLDQMKVVRKVVEMGLAQRKEKQIKVKQPLASIQVHSEDKVDTSLYQLILDELNIKEVSFHDAKSGEMSVELDTSLTESLVAEGHAREIVRKIQEERKKLGTKLDEKVEVTMESWPKDFEEYIKKNALVHSIAEGEFSVKSRE
jgi:isoleucyl-tRNA synthetase